MCFIKQGGLCIVFLLMGTSVLFLGGVRMFSYMYLLGMFFVVCVLCNPGSGMVCSLYFW